MADTQTTPVTELLNELLGSYWAGYAQHRTHLVLVESWGLLGLAAGMAQRIADEPVTIAAVLNRLLELGGRPDFVVAKPAIGTSLREVLENDLEAQRGARPGLNQAAELAAAEHDATTRILIETILADEERHLAWLDTELSLYHRLGEPLYTAQRLAVATVDQSQSPA
ncbi:bacterioferritin [Frankia sp. QA3]|uniref:ferritin-like domain-containing protein n=1 Tax=Frankia sp. QA3 TaxID=710111 RepID=UPI000269CA09|nr:ferritin-like domain-containing protein [Frankia sp. QA3]EIV93785.1 bacterioferritin (cytochrome b1) [Frankia sp. QA3]